MLADSPHPIVVERPIDAHIQRLQRWIDRRLSRRESATDDDSHSVIRSILTDVQLILDGQPHVDDAQETP